MRAPHVIPYQGSKRKIAQEILLNIDFKIKGRFFEPFAGSAAITLAAASKNLSEQYIIGDKYDPLIKLWESIIYSPTEISDRYEHLWQSQLDNPKDFFLKTRDQFNIDNDPAKLLYLVSRCVKNSIRFNSEGFFNQSPDNRRLGTNPKRVRKEIEMASFLLAEKALLRKGDFLEVLEDVGPKDVVYLDPPWQGTSKKRDPRYAHLLDLEKLTKGIEFLNQKDVPFLLSFDGTCGAKTYGDELPKGLGLTKIGINAGRSSQATLLGKSDVTIESLYLSPALSKRVDKTQKNTAPKNQLYAFC